jgi:hypothetical protein
MHRLPASPLIMRGLELAEKHLGIDELSRRLGAPAASLRAWRLGHATMPGSKFLKLVDILIKLDPDWTDSVEKP